MMSTSDESADLSVIVGLYVDKVSLEMTDLISSLTKEIEVMHSVNRKPEEGWAAVLRSAKKIAEFIDLFCKKNSRKISVLALVVLDKLQAAHNKLLDAARSKKIESTFKINTTSADWLQQSAKFFTYALIAERSGETVHLDLFIKAGETCAKIATQQHRIFFFLDMQWHWNRAEVLRTKANTEKNIMGNVRGAKIYSTVAHCHQALAAMAINNMYRDDASLSSGFSSAELKCVYESFGTQLYKITDFVMDRAMWQAEALLCELEKYNYLLHPAVNIIDSSPDLFLDVNARVEFAAGSLPQDQDNYLNNWFHAIPSSQIVEVLRLDPQLLCHYVLLLQFEDYLKNCVLESQTNMNTQSHSSTPFYRRLWKHIHSLYADRHTIVQKDIDTFLHTANSRSDEEWEMLHVGNSAVQDWMDVPPVLNDALFCLDFYTQQLQSVRSNRPAKVVQVVTRAWQSAQSCMQQLLNDLEKSVCKGEVFLSDITTIELQTIHNAACLRANTYAIIAQELYQNTASLYMEFRYAQQRGEEQCETALSNGMVSLAILAAERLSYHDTVPAPSEPEPTNEKMLSDALEICEQVAESRQNAQLHVADPSRVALWNTLYRLQIQYWDCGLATDKWRSFEMQSTLLMLHKLATNYDPVRNRKTIHFLMQAVNILQECWSFDCFESIKRSSVSDVYYWAAHAQDELLSMTQAEFSADEEVSITVARMRVDRYHCAALAFFYLDRKERINWFGNVDRLCDEYLLHILCKLLSRRNELDLKHNVDDYKQRSMFAWENAVFKEVCMRHIPQPDHICELLQDYNVVITAVQICQIDNFIYTFREQFTCSQGSFSAKHNKYEECMSWWKRAERAVEVMRDAIYAHCFDHTPVETIARSKLMYEAVKLCAEACTGGKMLHLSCSEVVDLALGKFTRASNSTDDAVWEQHLISFDFTSKYLQAALRDDTSLMEELW